MCGLPAHTPSGSARWLGRLENVSATVDQAGGRDLAERLGIQPGMVVQELGYDEDVDEKLRTAIVERCGSELADEDADGDLVDALVDAIGPLADNGVVWLLTPKAGRPGHVEPSDISEAAPTAGLAQTSSISAAQDWAGARLVAPKAARSRR